MLDMTDSQYQYLKKQVTKAASAKGKEALFIPEWLPRQAPVAANDTLYFAKLPKEVQDIIVEVAKEFEAKTGTVNDANYPKQLEQLKSVGAIVKKLPDSVAVEWAQSLKDWPQEKATELDKAGMPATQVLKLTLEEAEKLGHKWPVRYSVK